MSVESKDSPTVSIITPSFNSEDYLDECINSIKSQTFKNWELLITDDCSTDNSFSLAQAHSHKDDRIKVYRLHKNLGAAAARNHSIDKASGRFIAFCDSDDFWDPDKLEHQISYMSINEKPFTYTDYDVLETDGSKTLLKAPKVLNYSDLLRCNYIGCLTAVYDSKVLGKIRMPEIKRRQDWATWLVITKKGINAHNIGLKLATYRKRPGSLSSNKLQLLSYNYRVFKSVHGSGSIVSFIMLIRFLTYYTWKKTFLHKKVK